ncbi:MAG: OmpA family protein [bacterium]
MIRLVLTIILFSQIAIGQNKYTHSVYFDTDKSRMTTSESNSLNDFLHELDSLYIKKITIYGFCDDRGSQEYNLNLSKKRAMVVKDFFIDNEVSESQITLLDGKGELALDSSATSIKLDRKNNRRVDVEIFASKTKEKSSIEIPTAQDILKGKVEIGDKVRLKNLYFKTGYSTIVPESIQTLKEIAQVLAERKELYFIIQGHVCCTHDTYDAVDRKTNKRNLSVARAKFIYNYLLRKGVEKHRMKYVGLKRKFPLGGDPKLDRRVEIEITHIATKH